MDIISDAKKIVPDRVWSWNALLLPTETDGVRQSLNSLIPALGKGNFDLGRNKGVSTKKKKGGVFKNKFVGVNS